MRKKMKTISNRQLNVFLSYATEDENFAKTLYEGLIRYNLDVWFDKEKLFPGQLWDEVVRQALNNADIVIVLLSKHTVSKEGYIQKEIRLALDKVDEKPDGTVYLIPVKIGKSPIPSRLSTIQYVDIKEENGFLKLMESIRIRAKSLGIEVRLRRKNELINYRIIENNIAAYEELKRNLGDLTPSLLLSIYTVLHPYKKHAPIKKDKLLLEIEKALHEDTIKTLDKIRRISKAFNMFDVFESTSKFVHENHTLEELNHATWKT